MSSCLNRTFPQVSGETRRRFPPLLAQSPLRDTVPAVTLGDTPCVCARDTRRTPSVRGSTATSGHTAGGHVAARAPRRCRPTRAPAPVTGPATHRWPLTASLHRRLRPRLSGGDAGLAREGGPLQRLCPQCIGSRGGSPVHGRRTGNSALAQRARIAAGSLSTGSSSVFHILASVVELTDSQPGSPVAAKSAQARTMLRES